MHSFVSDGDGRAVWRRGGRIGTARLARTVVSAVMVLGVAVVSGCAGSNKASTAQLQRFNDPTDPGVVYRRPIINAQETEQQRVLENVVGGVALGVVAGALTGLATGNNKWWRDALIGGAAGGLAGYAKAYFEKKAAEARTKEELVAVVNNDARVERGLVTKATASVLDLRGFRRKQIADITSEFKSGAINQDVARARLADVKTRIAEDNELISLALVGVNERVDAYVDATAVAADTEKAILVREAEERAAARRAKRKPAANTTVAGGASDDVIEAKVDAIAFQQADSATKVELAQDVEELEILLG